MNTIPDIHLCDAPVVEGLPEPGLRGQLQAAHHEVADDVPVADEHIHRRLGNLDCGFVLRLLVLLVPVPLSRL